MIAAGSMVTHLFRSFGLKGRVALRRHRRDRLLALLTLACLTSGIAVTTTMFMVAQAMFLRPLPFPNGDRLVSIKTFAGSDRVIGPASPGTLVDLRANQQSVADMAAYLANDFSIGGDVPAQVAGARTTVNLFAVLGVQPEQGRLFSSADGVMGPTSVVIVSHSLAARALGDLDRAVGSTVRVDGVPRTVVGVISRHSY
jgi:hypothetical protein